MRLPYLFPGKIDRSDYCKKPVRPWSYKPSAIVILALFPLSLSLEIAVLPHGYVFLLSRFRPATVKGS